MDRGGHEPGSPAWYTEALTTVLFPRPFRKLKEDEMTNQVHAIPYHKTSAVLTKTCRDLYTIARTRQMFISSPPITNQDFQVIQVE